MIFVKIGLGIILILLVFLWVRKLISSLNPKAKLISQLSKNCLAAILREIDTKLASGRTSDADCQKVRTYLRSQKRNLNKLTSGYSHLVILKQGTKIPSETYNDIINAWVLVICPIIYESAASNKDLDSQFKKTMMDLHEDGPLSESDMRLLGLK